MNPAFQSTAVLGSETAPGAAAAFGNLRLLNAAAAVLALAALAVAAMAALDMPLAHPAAAMACAFGSLGLLRVAGAVQRRALADHGWLDTSTGLRNLDGLLAGADDLVARAHRTGKPLTLVVLDFADLGEVREIYGRGVYQRMTTRIAAKLQAVAGPSGLTARTGRTRYALVLPGMNPAAAQARLQRVLGTPCSVEYDAGESEVVLVPDVAAANACADTRTAGELYVEVAETIATQRAYERRRRDWLQRERERHSRPMSV